jgi:hypothetical protein
MNNKTYFGIALRVIILFTVAMLLSDVPDHFRDFFDDVKHVHSVSDYETKWGTHCDVANSVIDRDWVWGAKHHWYFWMMVILFLLSVVNVILSIVKLIDKYE